jgi:beta-N-acetylhexosaminidase
MTGEGARLVAAGEHVSLQEAASAGADKLRIVVMGVSGCGKTTIGDLVARGLGIRFLDGDSLHPVENVAKMAAGTPLTDEDRWPWLATVGSELAAAGGGGLVLACSALRRSYRDAIRAQAPDAVFLHLHGSKEVLGARIEGRTGHFMPAALLDSQLATLEPLEADEAGVMVDIAAPVDAVVAAALAGIAGIVSSAVQPTRQAAASTGGTRAGPSGVDLQAAPFTSTTPLSPGWSPPSGR